MARLLILLAALCTSGCLGVAYVAPTAVIRVESATIDDMQTSATEIARRLERLGYGRSDPADVNEIKQLGGSLEYWFRPGHPVGEGVVAIQLTRLPDAGAKHLLNSNTHEVEARFPLLELSISQNRSGGFNPDGLRAFTAIKDALILAGLKPNVVFPPPVDEQTHDRIEAANRQEIITMWLTAAAIYMPALLWLSNAGLKAARLQVTPRRFALVAIGVIALTPMPLFWMLGAVFVPNIFVLLSEPLAYFEPAHGVGEWLPAIFGASLLISTIAAFVFTRRRSEKKPD